MRVMMCAAGAALAFFGWAGSASAIYNGRVAAPGEYPAHAALLEDGQVSCNGTLVKPGYVVTAAHCVQDGTKPPLDRDAIKVGLGSNTRAGYGNERLQVPVNVVSVHPEYNGVQSFYDVAVLELDDPVTRITPVRISTPAEAFRWAPGTPGRSLGFGDTQPENVAGGAPSNELRWTDIPVITDKACRQGLGGNRSDFDPGVMVCATNGGVTDNCPGDSGGPLMTRDGAGKWIVFGLSSLGYGCAVPDPGLYTKVGAEPIYSWVQSKMTDAVPDNTNPEVPALKLSKRLKSGKATKIRYSAIEPLRLGFTVERADKGRRSKGRCRKASKRTKRGRRCTRYTRVGGFAHKGVAGANTATLPGRLRGRKLKRGSYRLVVTATDSARNRSDATKIALKVR